MKREDTVNGIPQIVQMATEFILQGDNAKLEGIFRVSGNQQHVKDLKAVFDKGTPTPSLDLGPRASN